MPARSPQRSPKPFLRLQHVIPEASKALCVQFTLLPRMMDNDLKSKFKEAFCSWKTQAEEIGQMWNKNKQSSFCPAVIVQHSSCFQVLGKFHLSMDLHLLCICVSRRSLMQCPLQGAAMCLVCHWYMSLVFLHGIHPLMQRCSWLGRVTSWCPTDQRMLLWVGRMKRGEPSAIFAKWSLLKPISYFAECWRQDHSGY